MKDVIKDYSTTFSLLMDYDRGGLTSNNVQDKSTFRMDYDKARETIKILKQNLAPKDVTAGFGVETDGGLKEIFEYIKAHEDYFKSSVEQAVQLLYSVIKKHPFEDGNKRIAACLFLVCLDAEGKLYGKDGKKKVSEEMLAALVLLAAMSPSEDKDNITGIISRVLYKETIKYIKESKKYTVWSFFGINRAERKVIRSGTKKHGPNRERGEFL